MIIKLQNNKWNSTDDMVSNISASTQPSNCETKSIYPKFNPFHFSLLTVLSQKQLYWSFSLWLVQESCVNRLQVLLYSTDESYTNLSPKITKTWFYWIREYSLTGLSLEPDKSVLTDELSLHELDHKVSVPWLTFPSNSQGRFRTMSLNFEVEQNVQKTHRNSWNSTNALWVWGP